MNSQAVDNQNAEYGGNEEAILIRRSLRSGQTVRFGGHVIVLGDINPGAEVVAAGNVVVMGALRGVVHAGAAGDEGAMIVAFQLLPTQIRIASHITRPPDGVGLQESFRPEMALIRDDAVVIEDYVAFK